MRTHVVGINNFLKLYEVIRTELEFLLIVEEAVKSYITNILGYEHLAKELANISRSIASRINLLLKDDEILGIIVGRHGGVKPISNNWKEARRLKPMKSLTIDNDVTELRTLELGVDIVFLPTGRVNKLLRNINHTKIYSTKL